MGDFKTYPIATSHFHDSLALNGFLVTAMFNDVADCYGEEIQSEDGERHLEHCGAFTYVARYASVA